MDFYDKDLVSIRDLTKEQINYLLDQSEKMIPYAKGEKVKKVLDGKVLGNLFFEPSTRTKLSFESAAGRLGCTVIDVSEMSMTSMSKGETLADTIKMVDGYCDVIVLRHPHEGAARLAAKFSENPVINAGDGAGSHPTQTLLDLFTMRSAKGSLEGLNIVLVGDLKYGRTVHSLAEALTMFGAKLTLVAPESLQMPKDIYNHIVEKGCKPVKTAVLEDVIDQADVLYVTRIQKERFPDPAEYQKVAGTYRIGNAILREAKSDMIVMHPLPRLDEILPEVDDTQHAKYFEQAFNGVPVRMALLCAILGGDING
ncbi:aspartate carbamoyltransferase [Candidatus Methanoplasma termitum]|uniref:Aspartate carbamoyltransferase n=1 Tax=Candidatus Methanoplasma termitum TaxID=1577791 RepID=A0A0A7LGN2_9ARCH|nr:aspartate carbamoyltransferase [Candidatus Methanoplasma termitum]AIZ56641.1 aspartate carbamoyltransferase [Candidatus Methanoplasma termitum]MCL2333862.1 aspartate carbamoyltransferase [Candidatus Methanoplasma sp.]